MRARGGQAGSGIWLLASGFWLLASGFWLLALALVVLQLNAILLFGRRPASSGRLFQLLVANVAVFRCLLSGYAYVCTCLAHFCVQRPWPGRASFFFPFLSFPFLSFLGGKEARRSQKFFSSRRKAKGTKGVNVLRVCCTPLSMAVGEKKKKNKKKNVVSLKRIVCCLSCLGFHRH